MSTEKDWVKRQLEIVGRAAENWPEWRKQEVGMTTNQSVNQKEAHSTTNAQSASPQTNRSTQRT